MLLKVMAQQTTRLQRAIRRGQVRVRYLSPLYDRELTAKASTEKKAATKLYEGNVFMVSKDDTQYAVSNVDHVGEIWLTNSGEDYEAYDKKKRSFLTLWLSSKMGEELAKRSKPTNHLNDWTTLHTQTENTLLFKRVFDIIKSFKLWMKCACVKNIMPVGMSSMRLI